MRVGFVGLGLMGIPMAENLLAAGLDLMVSSASAEACATLRGKGARVAGSVGKLAGMVDVLCSCRVTPEHSEQVFLGDDGVVANGRRGMICIDFATVTPAVSQNIATRLAEKGIGFIDAPISGGPAGVRAKTLSIIAGGSEVDLARVKPVLEGVGGKSIFHMGPVGAGVATKLCNNMVSITTHVLLAEAMVLGVKSGINPRRLYEVLRASSARSATLERVIPNHFLPRNFEAAASIATVIKDIECALECGRSSGTALRLAEVAHRALRNAAEAGLSERDIAAVILPIESAAGVTVGPA